MYVMNNFVTGKVVKKNICHRNLAFLLAELGLGYRLAILAGPDCILCDVESRQTGSEQLSQWGTQPTLNHRNRSINTATVRVFVSTL